MRLFDTIKKNIVTKEKIFIQKDVKEWNNAEINLNSETNNLCEFGKILVTKTRDMTINNMKKRIEGTIKGDISQEFREKLKVFTEEQKQALEYVIFQTVDSTLHNFLSMVEENDKIDLNYNGDNLKEISDGLCGELYSETGWIEKYTVYKK